jgi:hypothetical protein
LCPAKGRACRVTKKLFCAEIRQATDIFYKNGTDRRIGAPVMVRPDQFIAGICPLRDTEYLQAFFEPIRRSVRAVPERYPCSGN